MDAHALLTSQGWRGTGNSLHPTNNDIGLAKPLLVSRKDNTHGVGKKQHKTSDMWWMNAFDKSLQGLDTSKEGVVVQTVTSGGLDMVKRGGAKWILEKGGLYAAFVRGESLRGTITPEERGEVTEVKKRKREGESKEERRARKAAKRAKVEELAVKEPAPIAVANGGRAPEDTSVRADKKDKSKSLQPKDSEMASDIASTDVAIERISETKEERRARKAAKKAQRKEKLETVESATVPESVEPSSAVAETTETSKERKRLRMLAKEAATKNISENLSEVAKKKKRRKDLLSE